MQFFKKYWLLILFVILGGFLRFYQLGSNPPSLTWDEASLGYNAYSILQTGKDEYGTFLPLNLKSFGDYKPALYAYLTIPFVAIFGLNELAVRFVSALAGAISIVILFLIVKQLFKNQMLAFCVSLMGAISPLGIHFSRAAFETNLAVFLNMLGVLFFLKGLKSKKLLILSAVSFGLSLFTYQGSRFFVLLLLLGIYFIYRKSIILNKELKVELGIFSIFVGLIMYTFIFLGQSDRLFSTSFLSYQRSSEEVNLISKEDNLQINYFTFQFLHGEWFAYVRGFVERLVIYFSPRMLFIDGDYSPRHSIPDFGVLYHISALLLPLGLWYILKNYKQDSGVKLLLFWLLIAPLPAVFSKDLINMIRALNLFFPLTILEGGGLYVLFITAKNLKKYSWFGYIVITAMLIGNLAIFLDRYFIHFTKEYSQGWVYGYKEIINKALNNKPFNNYDKVLMTDKYGQPYIFYLFYTKYPPENYQKQANLEKKSVDVSVVRTIDNVEFRSIDWNSEKYSKNGLFIGTPEELPKGAGVGINLGEVNYLDGTGSFRAIKTP